MAKHQVQAGESFQDIARAYYGSEDAASALARCNGLSAAITLKPGTELSLPPRLMKSGAISERTDMKSVVDMTLFERRKDWVFVKIEENVYPGTRDDMVAVSGKWLYIVSAGEIVVRVEAVSADDWRVDNQLVDGQTQVSDGTVKLPAGRDYGFFVAPFALSSRGEQALVEHLNDCITATRLEALREDATTFVRDAYLWALDLHHELYRPALDKWRSWVYGSENAARLFIASALKCMIEQKDRGLVFDGTDPLDLRNELVAGEPENFLEQYQKEEHARREPAERAMAQLALMLDSYDFRALEQSALDYGDEPLALSLLVWAGSLECVTETLPGRELAARLVRDQDRIPSRHILTTTPPANTLAFAEVRYLWNAALAVVKNLAPALITRLGYERQLDPLEHIRQYLDRLSGEAPLKGTYRQMRENLQRGRPLAKKLRNPQKARKKLLQRSGFDEAKKAAAKLPPMLAKGKALSEACKRNFLELDTSSRFALEVINFSNAILDLKEEASGATIVSTIGASADFGALVGETAEILLEESSKKGLQRTIAVLGMISGICDAIAFAGSANDAADQYDYNQAVGHAISTAGAAAVALGSALSLEGVIAGLSAAAAGESIGGAVASFLSGATLGTVVGIIGAALIAGGTIVARLLTDTAHEQFAMLCFLGKKHKMAPRQWSWASFDLPTPILSQEMAALIQLLAGFQIEFDGDRHCLIVPGLCPQDCIFEVYYEATYQGYPPNAASLEVDPSSGDVRQLSGVMPLAPESWVEFDSSRRPAQIHLSHRIAETPSALGVLMVESRLFRVRMRLQSGAFVPPEAEDKPEPQWVEVEQILDRLGFERKVGHSLNIEHRANLQKRPFKQ